MAKQINAFLTKFSFCHIIQLYEISNHCVSLLIQSMNFKHMPQSKGSQPFPHQAPNSYSFIDLQAASL